MNFEIKFARKLINDEIACGFSKVNKLINMNLDFAKLMPLNFNVDFQKSINLNLNIAKSMPLNLNVDF